MLRIVLYDSRHFLITFFDKKMEIKDLVWHDNK